MRYKIKLFPLICFFSLSCLISSCSYYSPKMCESMAMKISQGNHTLTNQWQKYCKKLKTAISPKVCSKGFRDLVDHGNQEKLIKKFGPKIMGCFTKKDLKIFLIR